MQKSSFGDLPWTVTYPHCFHRFLPSQTAIPRRKDKTDETHHGVCSGRPPYSMNQGKASLTQLSELERRQSDQANHTCLTSVEAIADNSPRKCGLMLHPAAAREGKGSEWGSFVPFQLPKSRQLLQLVDNCFRGRGTGGQADDDARRRLSCLDRSCRPG